MSMLGSAGGPAAIRAAVDLFDEKVTADPVLAHYWEGIDLERLRAHQKTFLITALGGPELYRGRDMRSAHADLGITEEHLRLVLAHLAASLRQVGVAEDVVEGIGRRIGGLRSQLLAPPEAS